MLDVLVRKHRTIRSALGISLPIPGDTGDVINALAENVLLRSDGGIEERLPGFDDFLRPETEQLHLAWDEAAERETRSRSIFAQETIRPAEVAAELEAMQEAVGSGADVRLVRRRRNRGLRRRGDRAATRSASISPRPAAAIRDALGPVGASGKFRGRFDLPVPDGVLYLSRTNPIVSGLAGHVLDQALDSAAVSEARRCGVIRTKAVDRRTTLLLCRFRLQLVAELPDGEHPMLAEDAVVIGFTGSPEQPTVARPGRRRGAARAPDRRATSTAAPPATSSARCSPPRVRGGRHCDDEAQRRADALVDAHTRVREADARRGVRRGARYRAVAAAARSTCSACTSTSRR